MCDALVHNAQILRRFKVNSDWGIDLIDTDYTNEETVFASHTRTHMRQLSFQVIQTSFLNEEIT